MWSRGSRCLDPELQRLQRLQKRHSFASSDFTTLCDVGAVDAVLLQRRKEDSSVAFTFDGRLKLAAAQHRFSRSTAESLESSDDYVEASVAEGAAASWAGAGPTVSTGLRRWQPEISGEPRSRSHSSKDTSLAPARLRRRSERAQSSVRVCWLRVCCQISEFPTAQFLSSRPDFPMPSLPEAASIEVVFLGATAQRSPLP